MVNPEFAQTEAYLQIVNLIKPRAPLPFSRGWAASPDFLLLVVKEILKSGKKAPVIVEAGSGLSTVVLGYLLEKFFPQGTLISLEHSYDFYEETLSELEFHCLEKVNLLIAPMRYYIIDGKEWLWYDISGLKELLSGRKIDFLIIDGPPESIQEEARYPALPLLRRELASDFTLILDDANREGEKKASLRWKRELEVYQARDFPTEKGTLILKGISVKEKPFFSVCIPTYNRSNYLKEAIESVLAQTYSNWELVIYDDGSTDATEQVVRGFNDPRIKYVKGKENKGRPYARNKCIELSKGDWIVWLDDDDKLEIELLSNYAIYVSKYTFVDIFYPLSFKVFKEMEDSLLFYRVKDLFRNSSKVRSIAKGTPIPNPAVCVRKKLYYDYGFYSKEFLRAQDYEFFSRVLPFVEAKGVEYVGYTYRIHSSNVSAHTLKSDYSYESVIKRRFVNNLGLKKVYSHAESESEKVELFIYDLIKHEDYFNALYYSWRFNLTALFDNLALKSGILPRKSSLVKKFSSFLMKGKFQEAVKLSEKLGLFYLYFSQFFYFKDKDPKLSSASLKRAAMINPNFQFERFILNFDFGELESIRNRILRIEGELESDKPKFLAFLRGRDEDFSLHNS
jgi:glycosyltransferase involved in cell wall biosynthesis